MKRLLIGCLVAILFIGLAAPGASGSLSTARAQSAQTYTVLVGAENAGAKAEIMKFFPSSLTVHVGDTVHWQLNSMEIHTVTFLAGTTLPDFIVAAPSGQASPIMINPQLGFPIVPSNNQYDGSTYANSGIMGPDQGQVQTFSLTFTKAGTYNYECGVHGTVMSGTINVVDASTTIPSPQEASDQGLAELAQQYLLVSQILQKARSEIQAPVANSDGTVTFTVKIGYSAQGIDIMDFFPNHWSVRPGDTVNYVFSSTNDAPHTVTFLNGKADIPLLTPTPQPGGQPLLLINPDVLAVVPANPLTNQGVFNSGLMNPLDPTSPQSYKVVIGDLYTNQPVDEPYICILHDNMGMNGVLTVVAPTTTPTDLLTMNAIPKYYTSGNYILFLSTVSRQP